MHNPIKYILTITILSLTGISFAQQWPEPQPLFSAPQDNMAESRMRIAASRYESRGDFKQALDIYTALRSADTPSRYDFNYYQGQLRCLLGLEMYQEAEIRVRKEILTIDSNSQKASRRSEYMADLGKVYLATEREAEAREQFDLAIAYNPVNPGIYRIISNILLMERKEEEALEVLKRGETRLKNGQLARDIAMIYQQTMDYANATYYYLEYLRAQPKRYSIVERSIYGFPDTEETRQSVLSQLQANSDDPLVLKLLTGYLFSLKKYEEAFQYTQKLDQNGAALIEFAQAVAAEDKCALALQAYRTALEKLPESKMRAQLLAGIADCHQKLGEIKQAQDYYRRIITDFKFSPFAEAAYYKLGEIHLQTPDHADSAAFYFQQVRRLFPRGQYAGEAGMALAESQILTGDIDSALTGFASLTMREGRKNLELKARAMHTMGKCLLWSGIIDSALSVWNRIARTLPGTEAANDALYDALCFKDVDSTTVIQFGQAWLKLEQRKYEEAFAGFRILAQEKMGTVIAGRSAVEASHALEFSSGGEVALQYLLDYLTAGDRIELLDEIYYRMGEICLDNLNDPDKARFYFEELLVNTPESPRAPVVRRKLEVMAGGV